MRNFYIALEGLSAIILLILIYANVFEIKQHTLKRNIFTRLLIVNAAVVITDAITWINVGWSEHQRIFGILLAITYIVPFYIQAVFSRYLYVHISEKIETSTKPFRLMVLYAFVTGVITTVLCVTGKMFVITDGVYYSGPLESVYYLFYIVALILFSIVILLNGKKLGTHDLVAALLFCIVPLISIIISASRIGINLAVSCLAVNMLIIFVMLQSEREDKLIHDSNTDELTGLLNRRAYEDSLLEHPAVPPEEDFVYASIDINGLKQVNDNIGHAAGDELIKGAAYCLNMTLGKYGRVYRTGGDEFVAILFADEQKLAFLMEDLREMTSNWHGKQVDSLAMSAGFVTKREFPTQTVREMSLTADKRMYQDKRMYYASKGIDRRGQSEAYKVLCSLYTKILKINITNDSFKIINMDTNEQDASKGYSEKISVWLKDFATSGNVHQDDLESYLANTDLGYMREYFKSNKSSLTISYRRRYGDSFKLVMMDIIPADDYEDNNQNLFLYVKNIDI